MQNICDKDIGIFLLPTHFPSQILSQNSHPSGPLPKKTQQATKQFAIKSSQAHLGWSEKVKQLGISPQNDVEANFKI